MKTPSLWRFALAKEYRQAGAPYEYSPNGIERAGHALRWGVGSAAHLCLREIRNPVMIVALTAIACFATTIAFYPTQAMAVTATVCPVVLQVRPWMIHFALFILVESTILGVGMRSLGRLCNGQLLDAYKTGTLEPVMIGDRRV